MTTGHGSSNLGELTRASKKRQKVRNYTIKAPYSKQTKEHLPFFTPMKLVYSISAMKSNPTSLDIIDQTFEWALPSYRSSSGTNLPTIVVLPPQENLLVKRPNQVPFSLRWERVVNSPICLFLHPTPTYHRTYQEDPKISKCLLFWMSRSR